ncbi:MAG: GlcG/HbpS family heme-binding protein [Gammaproteobacteria bacterium]
MTTRKDNWLNSVLLFGSLTTVSLPVLADPCPATYQALTNALRSAVNSVAATGAPTGGTSNETNGGFDFDMWATVVKPNGKICQVTKTGDGLNDQWLGSRAISAQKAFTAISFSKPDLAISTANLYAAVQPGGSLFGLQFSNPVDPMVAYGGNKNTYGRPSDFLVNKKAGGVNVFGGGLALYDSNGTLVGALGVSGDTSCADHNIAWRVRDTLQLDNVPAGPGGLFGGTIGDNIVFDIVDGVSASGFGHPTCGGPLGDPDDAVDNANIIASRPLGSNIGP